jgi:hypothetical protein
VYRFDPFGYTGKSKESRSLGEGMDPGEQTTGARDEQYNLVSVLYHTFTMPRIATHTLWTPRRSGTSG